MTLKDAPRETIGLGLIHWPLYYGLGPDWARRRLELDITLDLPDNIDAETVRKVTEVLRRCDALGVSVGSLPGVRVGVLHCGPGPFVDDSGLIQMPSNDAPAKLLIQPSQLRLSVPAMVVDTRSWEIIWNRLHASLTGADSIDGSYDVDYLDVLEWHNDQFKGAPGRSAANLQVLGGASLATVAVDAKTSAECAPSTVSALMRAARLLHVDPLDLLDALLQKLVSAPSNGDRLLIARALNGRTAAPLLDVVGRLDLLAPCVQPTATPDTITEAVAASAERYARAQDSFLTDPLACVETTCRLLRSRSDRQPLVAAIRGPRLDPIELANGTVLRGVVNGDDGDHFDLTVRLVEGLEPRLTLQARSSVAPIPFDLLEERLRSALDRITDPFVPVESLVHIGRRETAWLSERLGPATLKPQELDCHLRILAHGSQTPDRRALSDDTGVVTYGQLRTAALATAERLRRAGVGREDRVAIVTKDLPEFVTGCLATLALGAAFVPLDPDSGLIRLNDLLERASVRVILTSASGSPETGDVARIEVANARLAECSNLETTVVATIPESLAYVMFTSGSTGVPKPVAVEHRALSAYVDSICERLNISAEMTATSSASFAADFGFTALWPALVCGATVAHCPPAARLDAEAFADHMEASAADLLKITPSHLSALLAGSRPERILPRRTIVFGGERLNSALVAKVHALRPELRIVNHYGPTETTIGVLTAEVTGLPSDADVPLGAPLPHAELAIVDEVGNPVRMGTPGELVISGHGVARGYLNDPRATADRFRPWQSGVGQRAYYTGDRALVGGDGLIRFRGRFDDQVQIRGWRVEPAEAEQALRGHPAVTEAVVTVSGDDGEIKLVAHVVAHAGTEADTILTYLRKRLPDYLIPTTVHLIGRLPLLPNGKVDRKALQESAEKHSAEAVLPRTEIERVVASIWAELMEVEHIDVTADVFTIGAHSLMATRALARIRELLATSAMITDVFRYRSVSEFARYLTAASDGAAVARRAAVVASVWDMTDDEVDQALKEET